MGNLGQVNRFAWDCDDNAVIASSQPSHHAFHPSLPGQTFLSCSHCLELHLSPLLAELCSASLSSLKKGLFRAALP